MSSAYSSSMLVAGSTSPSSSPSPSFASFSSGRTVAWWKESSSSPSPSSIAVPQAPSPSPRYGGLQRSMAIGRKRGAEVARRWSESKGVVYV
ncbi:hypothetical protein EYR40_001962 [Pleurotus pulmonarius]|nr:hypothetical protein EYR40_001962 [Pleurotus pulmonarius]